MRGRDRATTTKVDCTRGLQLKVPTAIKDCRGKQGANAAMQGKKRKERRGMMNATHTHKPATRKLHHIQSRRPKIGL